MLSNKWTFSLTYLVMLVAIGFIVTPGVIAHESAEIVLADGAKIKVNPDHPKPTLSVSEAHDVSSAEGAQVVRPTADIDIVISIDFSTLVNVLANPGTPALTATTLVKADAGKFDLSDISISAYDEDGVPVPAPAINADGSTSVLATGNPNNGKNAELRISFEDGGAVGAETAAWDAIDTLYVIVPESKFLNADPTLIPKAYDHAVSVRSDALKIELVGAEAGNAGYRTPPYDQTNDAVAAGTPGVVSITRALGATGFASAVTGAFDVRIILTEEPAAFDASHILVENGTASAPVAGSPIEDLDSEYAGGGYDDTQTTVTNAAFLPQATGRDGEHHQYLVTITPTPGFVGEVVVSVAEFDDMEKPVAKTYVPLVKSQRLEAGLDTDDTAARLDRIMDGREVLTVESNTGADAKVAAATAAYEARQKIYDANPSLKVLDNKAIIPAGGYLVLVADAGKAGVEDPKVKNLDKKTAAQKLYNKIGLGLPFPANDLSNFFRNGGTLNVAYQDITAATGSGHDDSKGPTGDDATNYTAASTNVYAAGAVIVSEIMWGLDKGLTDAQYIELHNTTAADIGIDSKEWVIAVGRCTRWLHCH